MTAFAKASHGESRFSARFARYLILTAFLFAMASLSVSPVEAYYYGYRRPSYFEQRLSQLYYSLSSRITRLEQRLSELSQQECQTGTVDFSICPGFKEANTEVITTCVVSPTAGAGASVVDMTVTFATPFSNPPIVDATFSGMSLLSAKKCTLEIIDVQSNQFTIRQTSDDFLPVATQASFFACPSASS